MGKKNEGMRSGGIQAEMACTTGRTGNGLRLELDGYMIPVDHMTVDHTPRTFVSLARRTCNVLAFAMLLFHKSLPWFGEKLQWTCSTKFSGGGLVETSFLFFIRPHFSLRHILANPQFKRCSSVRGSCYSRACFPCILEERILARQLTRNRAIVH